MKVSDDDDLSQSKLPGSLPTHVKLLHVPANPLVYQPFQVLAFHDVSWPATNPTSCFVRCRSALSLLSTTVFTACAQWCRNSQLDLIALGNNTEALSRHNLRDQHWLEVYPWTLVPFTDNARWQQWATQRVQSAEATTTSWTMLSLLWEPEDVTSTTRKQPGHG